MLMCAAIIGDNTGYFLGRQAGPKIFNRPKSKFFNPEHLKQTKEFYDKYGARAVVYARFVPIVRTCTPFIAGVARMRYSRFLLFSVFGGVFWIAFMTTLGYKLGQVPLVQRHFEKVVLAVIVLSLVPALLEARKARARAAETA
jgi:membrane-associated protein